MASVLYNRSRGKGGRGLRGLAPWRSMRQRLMRAPARLPPAHLSRTAFCPLSPAPLSPCFHPHSVGGLPPSVPAGVLNSRGAAISVANCRDAVACLPTFCRNRAVTPTRRFRILRRIQSSCIPDTVAWPLCGWPGFALGRGSRLAVVMRIVDLSGHSQPMQQHRQLAGDRHHHFLLGPLAAL